ncbi:hypothetical protein CCMA1212_000600 [Trichoderma ghanense]|uniref:Uncharacterized protein n=1 Tax=Trichoderma ghanense TaxID=65468 RepID=A0ABY2HH84_9HYPO
MNNLRTALVPHRSSQANLQVAGKSNSRACCWGGGSKGDGVAPAQRPARLVLMFFMPVPVDGIPDARLCLCTSQATGEGC